MISAWQTIAGPLGGFRIPASPEQTRAHVEKITLQTWGGEYDHPELPPADAIWSILDIGAGWGAFAVWAHVRWPAAVHLAYEPHDAAASFYEQNAGAFGKVRRLAVTNAPAPMLEVDWEWGSVGVGMDARGLNPGRQRPAVRVAAEHPSDLPRADLLKVDAEGVEAEVLAGYRHAATLQVLLYEYHSVPLRDECRAIVAAKYSGMRLLKEEGPSPTFGVAIWLRATAARP